MKSLVFILLSLYVSWFFTDVHSPNTWQNTFSPFCFILFLCAFVGWLVIKTGILDKLSGRSNGSGTGDGGGSFFGGDGGGSGGSGGDGGGC